MIRADELIVDNFAGGGGASEGIERALGRPIDLAINHDREALAMHTANHPRTKHLLEDVWQVDVLAVTQGRPVGLAWFSPVPWLLERCEPKASGKWFLTHSVEIVPPVSREAAA
jgi:hypothetical protein